MSLRQMFGGSIVKPGFNPLAAQTPSYTYNLYSWGRNNVGQLGLNNTTYYSSPKQVGSLANWLKISGGYRAGASIKTDGTLWTWGDGTNGQLGLGNTTTYSSPKQVGALTAWSTISTGKSVQTMSAIKTDGTLWTWGRNQLGQLGDGTTTGSNSPEQIYGGGTNWKTVSNGYFTTSALKTDGTLWCWGYNGDVNVYGLWGTVGDGTSIHRSSPVQISGGGTNWKVVAMGGKQAIAIRDDSADIFGNTL